MYYSLNNKEIWALSFASTTLVHYLSLLLFVSVFEIGIHLDIVKSQLVTVL